MLIRCWKYQQHLQIKIWKEDLQMSPWNPTYMFASTSFHVFYKLYDFFYHHILFSRRTFTKIHHSAFAYLSFSSHDVFLGAARVQSLQVHDFSVTAFLTYRIWQAQMFAKKKADWIIFILRKFETERKPCGLSCFNPGIAEKKVKRTDATRCQQIKRVSRT